MTKPNPLGQQDDSPYGINVTKGYSVLLEKYLVDRLNDCFVLLPY